MSNPEPPINQVSTPPTPYQPEWSAWMRQFMTVILVIATVYALTLLAPVLQILISTFLLAFLMYVPSRFVARFTRLNFTGSVVFCYVLLILLIFLAVIVLVPNVVKFLQSIPSGLKTVEDRAVTLYLELEQQNFIIQPFNLDMRSILEPLRAFLLPETQQPTVATSASALLGGISSAATNSPLDIGQIVNVTSSAIASILGAVSGAISTSFLAIFLSLLVLLDLPNYQVRTFELISPQYQREMRLLFDKMSHVWKAFFRGQVTLGVIIGVLTALQLVIMGVTQPIIIAIVVAIISLIPTIGGFISLIPLAIVPLIFGSTAFPDMNNGTFALLVVGINLVWTQVIWNVIAPKIMGDAVSLPLPVIIIGIFIGATLGGAIGAFLIVPIAGTMRVLVFYVLAKINRRDPFPGEETPELVQLKNL